MKGMNKFGIGFWTGAGIYSFINMIMNYRHIVQDKILNYNYIITGVAIFGLILNIILIKRKGGRNSPKPEVSGILANFI